MASKTSGKSAWDKEKTRELFRRFKEEGDMDAREKLVMSHLNLVRFIANKFKNRGEPIDDLVQVGYLGLLKAIDRFDPSFGTAFSTYAVPVILGEIRRFLRDDGSIHVARSIKENARRVEEARQAIVRTTGHEPTVDALCEAVGLAREDVLLALNARKGVRSLDACVDADGELPLGETLGADCMEAVEKRLLLGSLLKMLPREEMRLIAMRYFARRTQTDIAKEMGISQVQVSRMESRILKRLRQYAESGL